MLQCSSAIRARLPLVKLYRARRIVTRRTIPSLDEYVQREARPISLRQLTFFGRVLTEDRLLDFANYVRTELTIRLAHRIRDIQGLPYVVVANQHMSDVYDLYATAFEGFRALPAVRTVEDNQKFCNTIKNMLGEHLTVIPSLTTAVLESRNAVNPDVMDRFMNTMLRSRISRRVIAEQHLSLTETFNRSKGSNKETPKQSSANTVPEFVGGVFLRCKASDVVEKCAAFTKELIVSTSDDTIPIPDVQLHGHLDASFPYIPSHLEYIVGEILRNSMQASAENHKLHGGRQHPIHVLICEAPQHVIMRFSDRSGGIPTDLLPHIWSFSRGPHRQTQLRNLSQVPRMAATLQELAVDSEKHPFNNHPAYEPGKIGGSSLLRLARRPPDLRLGMGLPMSRVYAEYWAGGLEIQNLEGYGVDAFLRVSKLGNQSERFDYKSEFGMDVET